MRSQKALAGVCAAAVIAAGQVHAQTVDMAPDESGTPQGAEHPRGFYTGVTPGGDEQPAIPGVKPGGPATITWPGFQMQPDGSSRVFVQTTSRVDIASALRGSTFVVDFGNVSIAGTANRYPLITSYFNTPVTKVELKRENKRTRLELTLRSQIEPRVTTEQSKSGFYFVYIDFPQGNFLGADQQPAGPPPPEPGPPPASAPPTPEALRDAPSHLEGDASGGASAGASVNAELTSGTGQTKASGKAKAKGQLKIGL